MSDITNASNSNPSDLNPAGSQAPSSDSRIYSERASSPLSESTIPNTAFRAQGLTHSLAAANTRAGISRPPSRTMGTPPPMEIPPPDGTPKGQFLHDIYTFMQGIGQPITKAPHLGYQELDLYKLYLIVTARGGMDEVTKKQEWKAVYQELGIPTMSTSASYNTRTNYKKYLYLYELENCSFDELRPVGREPEFGIGDHVRIVSSNYDGQVFYAKVVKCRWKHSKNMYYVHYNGWSMSHDEWMPENVLSPLLSFEAADPEALVNPQPSRSSKSNNIIGELPQPSIGSNNVEARFVSIAHGKGATKVLGKPKLPPPKTPSTTSSEESESFISAFSRTSSHPNNISSKSSSRMLRSKVRQPQQNFINIDNGDLPERFTTIIADKVRDELKKLETEKILHYVPPVKPRFLNEFNIHQFNLECLEDESIGSCLNETLLEGVDIRVPNVEDLLGPLPIAASPQRHRHNQHETSKKPAKRRKTNAKEDEEPAVPADHHKNIVDLKKELKAVKKEYRIKQKLIQLYYGSSSSSSEGNGNMSSSSSTASASPDIKASPMTRRMANRRQRP